METGKKRLAAEQAEQYLPDSRGSNLLLLVAMIVGAVLLFYPSAADYWNDLHQTQLVSNYMERVAAMSSREYAGLIVAAQEYNRRLAETGIVWEMTEEQREEYRSLLDPTGTGIMGYIDVPKINVKLPLFHGTTKEVLRSSIGHMEQTSMPVGGAGSHSALSGHRGLPSAKLFSDLNLLAEGDTFTLSILDDTFTYEVDKVRVVLPDTLSPLEIEPGQDYCTLITCTPYGINSHRLLVRGHRVKNKNGNARVVADALKLDPRFTAPFFMAPMLGGLLILLFAWPPKKKNN